MLKGRRLSLQCLKPHAVDSALRIAGEDHDHFRDKGSQFLQPCAAGDHDDDRDRQFGDILLVFEPLIDRDKGIKGMTCCEAQQLSVPQPAQPICCTVRISNESGNDDASRLGVDSSSSTFIATAHQYRRRTLKQFDRLIP